MRRALNITVTAIVLGLTAWFAGPAAAREVPIGSITFQAQPEREVINVGGREGEFRGFRFEVRQSDVEVLDLRIVYGNGQTEDVRVRQLFRAGSSSRVIELGSPRRALRQIIVNFIPKGPARIMFVGIDNLGGGGGGSGGSAGGLGQNSGTGVGGNHGGGGGGRGGDISSVKSNGAQGVVRIIWGTGRSYPNNSL